MFRGREERLAAARANHREVRCRHEELASLYEMRVLYIDRGLYEDDSPADGPVILQQMVVPAR